MNWFYQYAVFSMSSGFFRWLGCWLLLVAPTALLAGGIRGMVDALVRRH